MTSAYELLIVTFETLGMLLVSFGLGFLAAWWLGTAGLLIVSGVALLAFATLVAYRQQSMKTKKTPPGRVL